MIGARRQLVLSLIMCIEALASSPKHVMFAFVDHFEPTSPVPDDEVRMWVDDYIAMASRHVDADRRHPIHSYFLISHIQPDRVQAALIKLNQATYAGYGEVEFHCHHGVQDEGKRSEKEATDELLVKILQAKSYFNMQGALVTAEPVPRFTFGFIHGMWALDNSRLEKWPDPSNPHRAWCGVNRELELLGRQGAYADFTFPAWGSMEPHIEDAIFYASDDNMPASYQDRANVRLVEVGQPPRGDLMIVEGPHENTNIGVKPGEYKNWPNMSRMHEWVAHNVHVIGNDDWIFIKVHTHGLAGDVANPLTWECFFGSTMDRFYSEVERYYNDGIDWKLHYVSAREMYNIIKAAEAGRTGDPGAYRDFLIPPYANMVILTANSYRLDTYEAGTVILEMLDTSAPVDVSLKGFSVDAGVVESEDPAGPWQSSDATQEPGQFGELHILDTTPSRYYCIVSPMGQS